MRNSKSIIAVLLAAIFPIVTSCGNAARTSENTEPTELVKKAYDNHEFTFEVNYVNPAIGQSFHSSDGYTLSVSKGTVNARLPFIGESHNAVFAGLDAIGIDFENCPVKISNSRDKEKYVLKFAAKSGSETYDVTLNIWPDGGAELICVGTSRSVMRYSGELK